MRSGVRISGHRVDPEEAEEICDVVARAIVVDGNVAQPRDLLGDVRTNAGWLLLPRYGTGAR